MRQLRGLERGAVEVRKFPNARPMKHMVYRQLYVVVARQKKERLLHRQGLKQHIPNAPVPNTERYLLTHFAVRKI